MNEAGREIRAAKKIVFIGYSLSSSDVHIKALFKKQITPDKEIIVINPKQKESLELNYKSLTKNVHFDYSRFEEFVNDENRIDSLFR
jgi:hypothetical protein